MSTAGHRLPPSRATTADPPPSASSPSQPPFSGQTWGPVVWNTILGPSALDTTQGKRVGDRDRSWLCYGEHLNFWTFAYIFLSPLYPFFTHYGIIIWFCKFSTLAAWRMWSAAIKPRVMVSGRAGNRWMILAWRHHQIVITWVTSRGDRGEGI